MTDTTEKLRGVNLGGWLVLEKWMTPSLFTGLKAADEYSLCQALEKQANAILSIHRQNFITEEDFKWIAKHGLNAVRLPVGYWIFGNEKPFVGGIEYVDQAFLWAERHNLKIILDLHGAPGSQNGRDHSGRQGKVEWKKPANITKTLTILDLLAERYHGTPALAGIEVLNEPDWKLGKRRLKRFYRQAYDVIRRHCGTEVAVIIPSTFGPQRWKRVLNGRGYHNVWLDVHFYQLFSWRDKRLRVLEHIEKVITSRHRLLTKLQHKRPIMVGEWSGALPAESFKNVSSPEQDAATRAYLQVELMVHETATAWFYWNYKTEAEGTWNYRSCYDRGLLPKTLQK